MAYLLCQFLLLFTVYHYYVANVCNYCETKPLCCVALTPTLFPIGCYPTSSHYWHIRRCSPIITHNSRRIRIINTIQISYGVAVDGFLFIHPIINPRLCDMCIICGAHLVVVDVVVGPLTEYKLGADNGMRGMAQ